MSAAEVFRWSANFQNWKELQTRQNSVTGYRMKTTPNFIKIFFKKIRVRAWGFFSVYSQTEFIEIPGNLTIHLNLFKNTCI